MEPLPTQYLERDGAALAYQVGGNGPVEMVHFFDSNQHLDLQWTDPDIHHNLEHVLSYSRSVFFQRRGFGLSETVQYVPTIEQQADDVLAVMDAINMARATFIGWFTSCAAVALVAAKRPERVHALILIDPVAQGPEAAGELVGWTTTEAQEIARTLRKGAKGWGTGDLIETVDPTMRTAFNRRLMGLMERSSATPAVAEANLMQFLQLDLRDILRSVQAPTRILKGFVIWPEAAVRHVADLVPDGTFHVLPVPRPGTSLGQSVRPAMELFEEVATGAKPSADTDRFLGTVLFTDVVSSTELLERIGDMKYREVRADHEREVRLAVEKYDGRLMTVTGDGTLSVFDSPTRAVRCAEKICREAERADIAVRAGIHTGELERDAMNVTGLTVHIGARVGATAEPGEVLVSRTVRDLTAGSGLRFASRGEHHLKGVTGLWELFAVTEAGEQSKTLPSEDSMQTPMDRMVLQAARRTPGLARAAVRLGNAVQRRRAGKQRH